MTVLVFLIIISLSFYVFYKVKYFRSKLPAEKKWISSKSGIALGCFIALFGVNQLFIHLSTISIIVSVVFILVGGINILGGIKSYKFYLPLAIQETEQNLK